MLKFDRKRVQEGYHDLSIGALDCSSLNSCHKMMPPWLRLLTECFIPVGSVMFGANFDLNTRVG